MFLFFFSETVTDLTNNQQAKMQEIKYFETNIE